MVSLKFKTYPCKIQDKPPFVWVLLFGLFLQPVGFDYRSKLANPRWRSAWDWALFAGITASKAQLGALSSMARPPINPSLIPVMFFPLVTGSRS
jgi:hypothetical protein